MYRFVCALALFFSLLICGCESQSNLTSDSSGLKAGDVKLEEVTFSFDEIDDCEQCQYALKVCLEETPGIVKVDVKPKQKVAVCKVDPEKYNEEECLKGLVEANYPATVAK